MSATSFFISNIATSRYSIKMLCGDWLSSHHVRWFASYFLWIFSPIFLTSNTIILLLFHHAMNVRNGRTLSWLSVTLVSHFSYVVKNASRFQPWVPQNRNWKLRKINLYKCFLVCPIWLPIFYLFSCIE